MATILYARVSTAEQTIAHQRTQAEAAGFTFDKVVTDDGVSGVRTTLSERAGGRRLFDLLRAGDVLVVRWIDRLGRDYQDVSDNIRTFMRRGVVVKTVVNNMTFDGSATNPMTQAVRDALIGFMAAMAQAEAEVKKEAQRAGIAHARAAVGKVYRGRKPSFTESQISDVVGLIGEGKNVSDVAKQMGLSRQAVYRIRQSPADAIASVAVWA